MIALFDTELIQKAYGKEKFDEGKSEGCAETADLMARLTMLLLQNGKIDELPKAGKDAEYRNKLYKEYNLV